MTDQTKAKHTPGPLHIDGDMLRDQHGRPVSQPMMGWGTEMHKANSARLVKCWNMHDELLEALRAVYKDMELQNVTGGSDELNGIVQAAIANAEGTE